MGCGFVAEPPGFTKTLLAWTKAKNILAFFFFNPHLCFFYAHFFFIKMVEDNNFQSWIICNFESKRPI